MGRGAEDRVRLIEARWLPSLTSAARRWPRWVRSWTMARAHCGRHWRRSAVGHLGSERGTDLSCRLLVEIVTSPQTTKEGDPYRLVGGVPQGLSLCGFSGHCERLVGACQRPPTPTTPSPS